MFYGSFRTQNQIVTFIFKFHPRKGQSQVKLGQVRLNFKIHNFVTEICLSCAVLYQDSKNVIYIYVQQLKMPKSAFKIYDVITFTCFLAISQPKTKILLSNFVCMLLVCTSITYIPVFGVNLNFYIL